MREPISRVEPDRVEVRGRDLTHELMGSLTFTEYFHLLLTGREPTDDERYFLDVLLVAIAEHGMMPSNVAARMTLAADPGSLHGAVAAGILGAGPVLLGTSEACAVLLAAAVRSGEEPARLVARLRGERIPGFGHPVHRVADPRAERIFELSDERGVSGKHVDYAHRLGDELAPVPLNVAMAIAAVLLDLGLEPTVAKAVPILARTAGLLAHLADEREHPIGFRLARAAEDAADGE
ncbi:MAG TPA: citryl-CoA lyase [Gaiellaceae bacterium]|nr:citryl-CoA lyase [Gaiellaceae bacterium]